MDLDPEDYEALGFGDVLPDLSTWASYEHARQTIEARERYQALKADAMAFAAFRKGRNRYQRERWKGLPCETKQKYQKQFESDPNRLAERRAYQRAWQRKYREKKRELSSQAGVQGPPECAER